MVGGVVAGDENPSLVEEVKFSLVLRCNKSIGQWGNYNQPIRADNSTQVPAKLCQSENRYLADPECEVVCCW